MGILDKSGRVDYIEDRRFVMKVFVVSIMLAGMICDLPVRPRRPKDVYIWM